MGDTKINEGKSVQFVGKGEKGRETQTRENTEHQSLKERRENDRRAEQGKREPREEKDRLLIRDLYS